MKSNSDTLHKNNIPNDIPRQRWLRIIPPILIACIISYMDRVNIAFAMPGGMDADLGITASMAGLAGGIFFIGYLFLQVPGGKIAVHGSGKKFIGWSLVAWVVISILTGLVTNHYQLLFLRFALGVAEGGMLPVVLTMISNWFPDAERGRANAIVIMFVPIAGIITAPLSGWIITALDWRWLFIIEGLMSVAVLVLWVMAVCDRPQEARWISEKEKKITAYHEAGHAVVSRYLPTQDPVHQISIVPRGMAGGYTMYRPTEDKSFMSRTEMVENIVSLLGGRVAEQLVLNDISTGASNDIERATQIARSMVTKYGMSERIGTITLGSSQEEVFLGRDFAQAKEYSEETANLIDEEVKSIIDFAYKKAEEILKANMEKLTKVANVLLEKEKIDGDEFDEIFSE